MGYLALIGFISFFTGVNAYVVFRLQQLFGGSLSYSSIVWFVLLAVFYPLSSYLAIHFKKRVFTRLYIVASHWIGFLGLFVPLLLIEHIVSFFVTLPQRSIVIGLFVVSVFFFAYAMYRAYSFSHKDVVIASRKVSRPYVFVHLSDLHVGPMYGKSFVSRLVSEIDSIACDAVLITGDVLDIPSSLPDDVLEEFSAIPYPVFAVSGNHDRYVGLDVLKRVLDRANITYLDGSSATLDDVTLVGIGDDDSNRVLRDSLPKLRNDSYNVLLYHKPQEFRFVAHNNVDLMLAGHTHAGQLLSFRPFVRFAFEYVWGLYELNNSYLHVSCGTGTWGPRMRWGSVAEITTIMVVPSDLE